MELLRQLQLYENRRQSEKEMEYVSKSIHEVYREWKKTKRRKNAVDIVSTSITRLNRIDPSSVSFLNDETKLMLATILMKCMDMPLWKSVESKEKTYKKLFPLIDVLQTEQMNTGTKSTLRQIIMTRLSAVLAYQEKDNPNEVFVAYETVLPKSYMEYLLGNKTPKKTYRMMALPLPEDFNDLIDILKVNIVKAKKNK